MLKEISLNGKWDLRDEFLTYDLSNAERLSYSTDGWIQTPVPGDIHQGLIEAGRIKEPLLGMNSYDCQWTENRSWWFRRKFSIDDWREADIVELEMNGLDSSAEILLNGKHIGSHCNTFRPFIIDIKPFLQRNENVLLVRLTTGVEDVSDADIDAPDGVRAGTEAGNGRPERGDPRRTMVRKPQYSFGWDWSPRLATTAIAGDVKIRMMNKSCIRNVKLQSIKHGEDDVILKATVMVDQFHYYKTTEGHVKLALTDREGNRYCADKDVFLRSGYNFIELTIPIENARLWWPNGMGDQHLYAVEAELSIGDEKHIYPAFEYGIRFAELDTRDKFAIIINGRKVFCKGANWIPADALYARTSDEKYENLIHEAKDANFNMLRIWGGGLYEKDAFYKACDKYGIMIWHDLMFACAPYPDHLESFRIEVEKELDYQTKRLQRHACIVLWSGSNENNWGFRDWWGEKTKGGAYIYNYLAPAIIQDNTPEIPYWNGSPYGGNEPNSSEVGDRHHWHDCMMNPDMQKRITPEEYDKCTSLFVSEFGYIGACAKETILNYMDGAPLERKGDVWHHHTNTFEKDTVEAGIMKHYADPDKLTFDDYLLYSGLCQGLMYGYALDSMRYRSNCHGSLFWMYNDCWGEIGWTIIDYYLRRKPSWYFVRRTYAPLRLIMRAIGDKVSVVFANDTQDNVDFELEYGYISLDGNTKDLETIKAAGRALDRTEIMVFQKKDLDATKGLWIARAKDRSDIEKGILRVVDYRQLQIADPGLSFSVENNKVKISSKGYAHAVYLTLPDGVKPSDNYFDLFPGETHDVEVISTEAIDFPQIRITCANSNR